MEIYLSVYLSVLFTSITVFRHGDIPIYHCVLLRLIIVFRHGDIPISIPVCFVYINNTI